MMFSFKKVHRFFNPFVEAFWTDCGSLDPPKLSSSGRETLFFGELQYSLCCRFFFNFGLQKPPKIHPKSINKSIKKNMQFYIETSTKFYQTMGPTWSPKGSQRPPKTSIWKSLRVSFSGLVIQVPPSR